jgi:hypothetical protein
MVGNWSKLLRKGSLFPPENNKCRVRKRGSHPSPNIE